MRVKIIANKPDSGDCSDISEYIGQIFYGRYDKELEMMYVQPDPNEEAIGLFPEEYEIIS